MALLILSEELAKQEELFEALVDSFDSIQEVSRDRLYGTITLRVQCGEVPQEDKVICPLMYQFEGVRPFIIEYDS